MKKIVIIITLILALVLTSCSATVEKGKKLMSDRKYDDAIEVFQKVIEKDETNYDAWFGIIKSQIKNDEYDDAEDSLKDLFEIIDENYDEGSDVDYEPIFDDFQKYADDIIEEEGSLSRWYDRLIPAPVDITSFDYQTYETGTEIVLTVPEETELYYNMANE
ncbi:MAG: tetratricopeptide repeat protein, partial [Vallitaleaceae bacterium]|nr:tetratricopeptide repeat protein [Vallitaleaceae bacterium]